MDFNKLSQNEKLAVYGSVAVVIGGLVGYAYSVGILAVLAAILLLVVIFLPQLSPQTTLPGSKGSLMVALGGAAAILMVLALLVALGAIFTFFDIRDLFFLIAVAGALVAGYAGWQEFQAEGGRFQIGGTGGSTPPPPPPPSA
jgi:hypothetical protein